MSYYADSDSAQLDGLKFLTIEQEADFARKAAKGDTIARDALIGSVLKLAIQIALRTNRGILPEEDAISVANEALVKLVSSGRFDPSRGLRLSTFVAVRIRGAVLDAIEDGGNYLRLKYTEQTISEAPRISEDDALRSGATVFSPTDLDNVEPEKTDEVSDGMAMKERVQPLIDKLPARTRQVILMVYFQGLTLAETGRKLGVSREAVRKHHNKGLLFLRSRLPDDFQP